MANLPVDIGAPINGNIWRIIANSERGTIKAGDIVHKAEEIANPESMKMENAFWPCLTAGFRRYALSLIALCRRANCSSLKKHRLRDRDLFKEID